MPERSPLMSAANIGTPARANPSAITCSETVFPVPVAPVTRPWRFASANVSHAGCSPFPMKIFSSVSAILVSDVTIASPLRAHRGLQPPDTGIILHLASRLKPVNAFPNGTDPRQFPAIFSPALALLQHSLRDRRFECGHCL